MSAENKLNLSDFSDAEIEKAKLILSFFHKGEIPETVLLDHLRQTQDQVVPKSTDNGLEGEDSIKAVYRWNEKQHGPLIKAPYAFATLNSEVVEADPSPDLDRPVEGGLSATIEVEWQFETPFLVGAGEDSSAPFVIQSPEEGKGQVHAIPGASIRGMLRAELEALTHGRMYQINRHYRFALRNFDHPYYRRFIEKSQPGKGLKAGWLQQIDRKPHITPCESWGLVPIIAGGLSDEEDVLDWVRAERNSKNIPDRQRKYEQFSKKFFLGFSQMYGMKNGFDKSLYYRKQIIGNTDCFIPRKNNEKPEISDREGFAVFSGGVPVSDEGEYQKDHEYVFFDHAQPPKPWLVSETRWLEFKVINCEPRKNELEPQKAWKEFQGLYKAGKRLPVFYVGDLDQPDGGPDFSFGLTRLYRLPHRFSLGNLADSAGHDLNFKDGLVTEDFCESLFGHVHEGKDRNDGFDDTVARKGRIAISFAVPVNQGDFELWPKDGRITTVQGAPKYFDPFYLAGEVKDYSDPRSRLAGRKFYRPRRQAANTQEQAEKSIREMMEGQAHPPHAPANIANIKSELRFLKPRNDTARMKNTIRLHNVRRHELGAVLWALTFGENGQCRHMIGRGKPFGAGQARVAGMTIHLRPHGGEQQMLKWPGTAPENAVTDLMGEFESWIAPKVEDWAYSRPVTDFLAIHTPKGWPDKHMYLPFGGNGKGFSALRKHTNSSSTGSPRPTLLKP